MIKDIKYSGHSANPSDYESPDGDLTASINLINDGAGINTIPQPAPVLTLLPGERVLLIHQAPGQKNYILARTQPDGSLHIYWQKKDPAVTDTLSATYFLTIPNLDDITAVGNTLVCATRSGLSYTLWSKETYIPLKDRPPFVYIDFGMTQVGTLSNFKDISDAPKNIIHPRLNYTEADIATLTQMAYGLLNPALAEVTSKGFFHQPFFLRYAFRMYDGSYSYHSVPILMLPTILPPWIVFRHAVMERIPSLQLNIPFFGLTYKILADDLDDLKKWSDIIKGIDIFISTPIYTYDGSKNLPMSPIFYSDIPAFVHPISPDTKIVSGDGVRPYESAADIVFVGHYSSDGINGKYYDHTIAPYSYDDPEYPEITAYFVLNIAQHPQFYDNIKDTHNFYKLAEIDFEDIKATNDMQSLLPKIKDKNLANLATREELPDDANNSHRHIVASSLYAFNSRLNLAGVETSPAIPFPPRAVMQFGNPKGVAAATVRVTVWTYIDGVRCKAVYTGADAFEASTWFSPESNFPRYIFYPDRKAYKMEFYINENTNYTIDLKSHDFLNGAYYFAGKEGMGKDTTPVAAQPETADCPTSVSVGSKVYTSEINNPWTFKDTGINTVGSGEVLGICSAAKALSQGQFGQFPLYAFTTEGVWALETGPDGSFLSKHPVTRDVCTNPKSITQLDSSVLFATDRGIILLSGAQTQCITDAINADTAFGTSQFPGFARLESMLGYSDKIFPFVPFMDFLTTCGIIYDYPHQHIILYSPDHKYSYVYSLKSHQWGMMYSDIESTVKSYPEALAVDKANRLVNFSGESTDEVNGLLLTRPLKLDAPDVLKTIDTVIQRGHFRKGHIQSVLYGSRDLYNWNPVWSSRDHYLRGFRGTPYKYFRIGLLCDLTPDEKIFGASIQFNPRHLDQPR